MKNRIYINYIVLVVLLGFYGCMLNAKVDEPESIAFDQTSNWVILNKIDGLRHENSYAWNFDLKYPADYVVQVVFDTQPEDPTDMKVEIDDQELQGVFNQDYVTYNEKRVSEFKGIVNIPSTDSKHALSISTEADFDQIRIIPSHKTPLGSNLYHDEWIEMHESPEKQSALEWFKNGKFGMFIHWGLYSQAGGMWEGVRINKSPHPGPKVAEWLMHAFQISY